MFNKKLKKHGKNDLKLEIKLYILEDLMQKFMLWIYKDMLKLEKKQAKAKDLKL